MKTWTCSYTPGQSANFRTFLEGNLQHVSKALKMCVSSGAPG